MLADFRFALFPAAIPDVRDGDKFEIEFFGVIEKSREQAGAEAIGKAYHANPNAVVRPGDARVAGGGQDRRARQTGARGFQEFPASGVFHGHKSLQKISKVRRASPGSPASAPSLL